MDLKHTAPCTEAGIWEGARVWTPIDGTGIVVEVAPAHTYGITVAFPRRPDGRQSAPLGYLLRDLHLDLTHGPTRLWAEALRKAPAVETRAVEPTNPVAFDLAAPHEALRRFVQGAGRGYILACALGVRNGRTPPQIPYRLPVRWVTPRR